MAEVAREMTVDASQLNLLLGLLDNDSVIYRDRCRWQQLASAGGAGE